MLSIVIPTLNEAASIEATLASVLRLPCAPEVIVVDGGSRDGTPDLARRFPVLVLASERRGRGMQLRLGAEAATGEALWFVHADTLAPPDAYEHIRRALRDPSVVGGNFSVRFSGASRQARFFTWLYPQLRRAGLLYGDSAIFVRRSAYEQAGGFGPQPIFEDLDLVRRLRRLGRLAHVPAEVVTSSRRFEGRSFLATVARWNALQLLFWMGVAPATLDRYYRHVRRPGNAATEDAEERGVRQHTCTAEGAAEEERSQRRAGESRP